MTVALDLATHGEVFGPLEDAGHYKCVGDVLTTLARMAVRFNAGGAKDDPVRLEFTFDRGPESHRKARTLYSLLRNEPE